MNEKCSLCVLPMKEKSSHGSLISLHGPIEISLWNYIKRSNAIYQPLNILHLSITIWASYNNDSLRCKRVYIFTLQRSRPNTNINICNILYLFVVQIIKVVCPMCLYSIDFLGTRHWWIARMQFCASKSKSLESQPL